MPDAYDSIGTRLTATPQSEKADERQEENHAGGFTFAVSDREQLRRFLILGSDGGTYYANAKDHTKEAAEVVLRMAKAGDMALVEEIAAVSYGGLAPRQQPTLVALAAACASEDDALRQAALDMIPKVCRTFTMLATFLRYVKGFRGMGRGLRTAVARFYEDRTAADVAYQMVKYRQREGYTHRDVLRIAHPKAVTEEHRGLYDWACGRAGVEGLNSFVNAYDQLSRKDVDAGKAASLVTAHRLPWEAVPDALVNDPKVLEALLPSMGATALLRQLPRFARAGLTDGSFGGAEIARKLCDEEFVKRGKLHPYQVLLARATYASGRSFRGSGTWTPSRMIVEALEATYELSFQNVEPSGTRTGLFLDVSGSMGWAMMGDSPLTAREGAAAMAMATLRTEPFAMTAAFTGGAGGYYGTFNKPQLDAISRLDLSPRDSLTSVISKTSDLPFGGTDCALPMLWAMENEPTLETFIVYTDNETWAGTVHPHQALRDYRRKTGINAKLIVVGMTATRFTIADPSDRGMMDVVGFSPETPRVMAEFAAGRL